MNIGLPLEVLGLLGPILCWVERVERSGLPAYWYGDKFPFKERMRAWLLRDLPTYSYDNLDEIIKLASDRRKSAQFPDEPRSTKKPIYSVVPPEGFDLVYMSHRLSKRYFRWTGNELCIHEGRLVELHEVAMRFPVRHLIRHCHADAVARGYISKARALELPAQMSQLHTTYQSLRSVVEKGIYEGHLHLNGVISADESWADHVLRNFSLAAQQWLSPEEKKLMVLSRTALRILAMGVLYLLAEREDMELPFDLIVSLDRLYQANPLEDRSARDDLKEAFIKKFEVFRKYLEKRKTLKLGPEYNWLMLLLEPGIYRIWRGGKGIRPAQETVVAKPRGIRSRIALLDRLLFTIHRILVEYDVRIREGVPISDVYGINLLGFAKKRISKKVREFIHQVFIRCLIYHTHHWQKATQSGKTTGLRYFQKFFGAPQRWLMTESPVEEQGLAIEKLSQVRPLRVVEGRLSPSKKGISDYMPWIVAFASQAKDDRLDKFGIVIHFIKKSYDRLDRKTRSQNTLDLRYGKIRRLTQVNASRLFRLLSCPNPVVPFIVGIDAANLELTTPPEVFAPAFRFLREFPIKIQPCTPVKGMFGKYEDIAVLAENRRLGMTYHVGEDFRHLLSGLRAIHEVIEFLKPLPGDRMSQAIALALEPEVWAAQVGYQSVIPRQEWLDNLVWVHHLLGPGHNLIGELAVEDQIQFHSRKIYGETVLEKREAGQVEMEWMPATLYDSWRLRQLDPYSLDPQHLIDDKFRIRQRGRGTEHRRWADVQTRVLNDVDQYVGMKAAYHLVKLYWYGPKVHRDGKEIITIDIQEKKNLWLKVFHEAQQKVQDMVREQQLVVEVNPSSNRVIGPLEKLADHPIFKLTLDKEQHLARQVRVTINTDDPGVFSTSLTHEFYLLGEILVNRGVPEAEVGKWLDWLRKNGRDYSFLRVLPDAKDGRMASIIDCLLEKYAPLLRRLRGEKRQYRPPMPRITSKTEPEEELRRLRKKYEQLESREEELKQLRKKYERLESRIREIERNQLQQ